MNLISHPPSIFRLFTKIFAVPLTIFTISILLKIISSLIGVCGWEEILKFIYEAIELLTALSLTIIYFIPLPKNLSKLKSWSSSKISSQNSNASLAPSRLSHTRGEVFHNWYDAHVVHPISSAACYDNDIVYENISTLPEPCRGDNKEVLSYTNNSSNNQRHTIRQVMLRAKKNVPQVERMTPKKCSMPPIPKIIPNQILDDVQLFDAYYKSLDSLPASSDSGDLHEANKDAQNKRISLKNIGRAFMPRHSQHKTLNAASNDE